MIALFTNSTLRSLVVAAGILLLLVAVPKPARGQEIHQTVARIAYLSGPVSYNRGDDPDEWEPANINVPFTLGDRIYSPRDGRAELQLPRGNFVRLGHRTYFTALNLTYDVKQFYLGEGAAAVNIRRLGREEIFEIATPNMAVNIEAPGRYRIEVDEDGNSRVVVRRGRAVVAAQGRQVTLEEGEMRVFGVDSPRYEVITLRGPDGFDRWVDERENRFDRAYSGASRYVSDQVIGLEELAEHGRWEEIPDYGHAWTPHRVPVGWQPFTAGRWFWQDPWGWTWISDEPWGWAPGHYGRWTFHRSRWYWVPVERRVTVVRYAPAVVTFVRVRDHVGWFPLHPRDRFIPWWGPRSRIDTQNITYVNRTHVTIVNQNTFISARSVTNNIVRDSVIVRETNSARVLEQPLPVPTRSSLRVATGTERGGHERPPANVLSRPAVVRAAPAPPPPTFQDKLPEIQKSQGEPIAPDKAVTMGLKEVKTSKRNPIRPAAVEENRADFAPRTPSVAAPAAQPLTPPRGKKLATREAPVITSLQPRAEEREKAATQPEQGRTSPSEPSKVPAKPPEQQEKQQQQEQGRQLQKDQQREEQPRQRQLQGQQRKDQELQRQEQGRQRLEREQQEQLRKEQQLGKEQQRREDQQRSELERQQQQQERKRQQQERQALEQQRKEQQLQKHQQRKEQQLRKEPLREEQQRGEQARQQQERQNQKDQQRKDQRPQKEQERKGKQPQGEDHQKKEEAGETTLRGSY